MIMERQPSSSSEPENYLPEGAGPANLSELELKDESDSIPKDLGNNASKKRESENVEVQEGEEGFMLADEDEDDLFKDLLEPARATEDHKDRLS